MLPIDLDGRMKNIGILSKQFEIFEWTNVACGLSGDLPKTAMNSLRRVTWQKDKISNSFTPT